MKRWCLQLTRYALPEGRSWLLVLVLMLIGTGAGLLAPWPLKLIVDVTLSGKPFPPAVRWVEQLPGATSSPFQLAWLAAATVLLFLIRRAVLILQEYVQAGAGSRMVYQLASDLFAQLQARPPHFHSRQRIGDLVRRVTADTACVRKLVTHVYLPLARSLVTMASTFFIMWQMSRALAMFAVGLSIPLGIVVRIFARPMSQNQFQQWERQGEIASFAEQTLTALPMVQAFGQEEWEDRRFGQLARKTVQATLLSELSQHYFKVNTGAVHAFATAVVMIVGGLAVLEHRLSVGDLLVLIAYFAALYSPIETLAYLSEGVASVAAGAKRVMGILETGEPPIADSPGARPLPRATAGAHICLDNVTFGYEPDRPVLRSISLQLRPGEIVALVGPTGAGKSTLAALLLRFVDPQHGTISINGLNLRDTQIASLRSEIAYVPQESFLLPLTIAENIAYGCPLASREEIIAAAKAANADSFITTLSCGYDTVIGERGVTLSGGEKQRLSLARALLKNAAVLILDEPTSALDGVTERHLLEAIEQRQATLTTLIISHRLSTIRRANRIVVLQDGKIVEEGTHEQLIANCTAYSQFYDSQLGTTQALAPGRA